MQTPMLGGSYLARSRNLAYDQSINVMPVMVDKPTGKAVGMLIGTPGLVTKATVGTGPIRGGISYGGLAYVVSGNGLYKVDSGWEVNYIGALHSASGPVSIINNTTQVLVSDAALAYVATLGRVNTFSVVSSFPGGGQILAYQDGWGITNIAGSQQFNTSNLEDLSNWSQISSTTAPGGASTADAEPDPIMSIVDCNNEIWFIGENHSEIWVNPGGIVPGGGSQVFQRLAGVQPEIGCIAPYSAIQVSESVMFLGQDRNGQGLVYKSKGYGMEDVTDEATAYAFAQYAKTYGISDAFAFCYQQEKHYFYWLIFPSANVSWVYDISAGRWHQRAYWSNGQFSRHRANCSFFFNGFNIVGDYQNGNLYALDLDTSTDAGAPKRWVRSWRALPPGKQAFSPMTFNSLVIDAQTGVDVPSTVQPEVCLRWSDDGGHTWSNERQALFGNTGETGKRVKFNRLGSTKVNKGLDRIFELSGDDPVPIVLMGADMDAEPA